MSGQNSGLTFNIYDTILSMANWFLLFLLDRFEISKCKLYKRICSSFDIYKI